MLRKIFDFYYSGFTSMDIGKKLWLVIIIKLVIIFFVVKLFFMPDVLSQKAAGSSKADYISSRMTGADRQSKINNY